MLTGTYTTSPVSTGHFGRETTRRETWRLHSLHRVPFAPGFYLGVREDTGQLVQVHEHGLVFDAVPEPRPEQNPS